MTSWYCSPSARAWTVEPSGGDARAFHRDLPGYAPTPLVSVPELAAELGVGRVLVKDESTRLGLPAFKVLGASWACRQVLERAAGLDPGHRDRREPRPRGGSHGGPLRRCRDRLRAGRDAPADRRPASATRAPRWCGSTVTTTPPYAGPPRSPTSNQVGPWSRTPPGTATSRCLRGSWRATTPCWRRSTRAGTGTGPRRRTGRGRVVGRGGGPPLPEPRQRRPPQRAVGRTRHGRLRPREPGRRTGPCRCRPRQP